MSNVIHVKGYTRRKTPPAAYVEMAERLYPYDLGDMLIGALERELSEPLDSPQFDDVPDDVKQRRMREAW